MIKLLLIISLFSTLCSGYSQTGNLTILVPNISGVKGYIQLGLFDKSDNFPTPGKELKVIRFKVTSTKMKYTIKNLPQGDYALAIFHDIDSNKECDLNFFGVPTENYGFSNNVKPVLSAPSFSNAKIILEEQLSIIINLL